MIDFETRLDELTDSRSPLLIGVRHHSAALARAMPYVLDDFRPEAILIEMPADLQPWIEHLGDEQTTPPIALSVVRSDQADQPGETFFYPLAEFSPEWTAIRWAVRNRVPVVACDLAAGALVDPVAGLCRPAKSVPSTDDDKDADTIADELLDHLMKTTGAADSSDLWQRLVESPAGGRDVQADAQRIRRAALAFGLAIRGPGHSLSPRDYVREAAMRRAIHTAPVHCAAIVGSFHAAMLTPNQIEQNAKADAATLGSIQMCTQPPGVALVPYSFEQFDSRSGYPSGVLDPAWHHAIATAPPGHSVDEIATRMATSVCRDVRRRGHVAGTPDATEIVRLTRDLATLRGLAAPGRGEFVESVESCLLQGDRLGRGRAIAVSMNRVMVGHRRGKVTPKAPRCGLIVDVEERLAMLKLPGRPDFESNPNFTKQIRLDVMRDARDRARSVTIRQLATLGIPYAKRLDGESIGGRENLIERWECCWQATTSATIESAAGYGVTLPSAVSGNLRTIDARLLRESSDEAMPAAMLNRLETVCDCGLVDLVNQSIGKLNEGFRQTASIAQLIRAATWIARIQADCVVGLPQRDQDTWPPLTRRFELASLDVAVTDLLDHAIDRLSGLEGSDDPQDVDALSRMIGWFSDRTTSAGTTAHRDRLVSWCRRTRQHGGDRMAGAAAAAIELVSVHPPDQRGQPNQLGRLIRGWIDGATDTSTRDRLRKRLAGVVAILLSMMQSDPQWSDDMSDGIAKLSDQAFLNRLPALRYAFADQSPADRQRVLDIRLSELTERKSNLETNESAIEHAERDAAADLAGRAAVIEQFPETSASLAEYTPDVAPAQDALHGDAPETSPVRVARGNITLADRWRMTLGIQPEQASPSVSVACATLDRLYGRGRGEGSRGGLTGPSSGGGTGAPQPMSAEWTDDLQELFDSDVCQEVLGEAAAAGDSSALAAIDPDSVQPSIELLQQVLSLAGAVPESRLATLRSIAARITDELAKQLATRLSTALSGLSTPRPTRRRSRRLDLPRTIRDNLRNAHRRDDGSPTIIAERLVFNAPAKRELDWHLTFVVDVSGSMEASIVYSALVAAIFDALPALSVRFIAFSTEVVDLTDQVGDPLSLLLGIQIGGGTDIGLGLRAARSGITVPSRSLVVVVSDFEEGVSVGGMVSEVRALVDAGVTCLGLAALDDFGKARFHQGYATIVAAAGMPVAAVSPERLAGWIGDQIRGRVNHGWTTG